MKKKNRFLYLLLASFIFVAAVAIFLWEDGDEIYSKATQVLAESIEKKPPTPTLSGTDEFPVISAQAVTAIDLATGTSLYQKNPDVKLLPASTTKMVTALVALDVYPLDSVLKAGSLKVDGQKMGLYTEEEMKVEDLLYGLLVYSANDAALVLAQNYPGGYPAFVDAMNKKAESMGLTGTHFENPIGLDGVSQQTTANDLVRVATIAMQEPEFAKIVGTKEITVTDVTGKSVYKLRNINELLGSVPGVLGVKTGWTENARENLVTYISRDEHDVVIALLGSQDRFGETKELIEWIFKNYTWE